MLQQPMEECLSIQDDSQSGAGQQWKFTLASTKSSHSIQKQSHSSSTWPKNLNIENHDSILTLRQY